MPHKGLTAKNNTDSKAGANEKLAAKKPAAKETAAKQGTARKAIAKKQPTKKTAAKEAAATGAELSDAGAPEWLTDLVGEFRLIGDVLYVPGRGSGAHLPPCVTAAITLLALP